MRSRSGLRLRRGDSAALTAADFYPEKDYLEGEASSTVGTAMSKAFDERDGHHSIFLRIFYDNSPGSCDIPLENAVD
ncbi:MAG TPA: hypothetical protein VE178_00500 [Silvibacterium sp.]|nr:hypothetical protein [Silvibacterium sp.]